MAKIDISKFSFPRTCPTIRNFTGQQFGQWLVLAYSDNYRWLCLCDCGTIRTVQDTNLCSGRSQSCGCARKKTLTHIFQTHGESMCGANTPEYRAYNAAKRRCSPHAQDHANYGGRGIQFRFRSYEEFLLCLGRRPSAQHSLDRINNDGHYESGNVRWATRVTQARNRRNLVLLTIGSHTRAATEWAEIVGCAVKRIYKRKRLGWCDRCAVHNPPRESCSHSTPTK